MENINTNNKRVVFKLKHWEGVTLFKVIEQEGIERGCGEIYSGSNGWRIISQGRPAIKSVFKNIQLRSFNKELDNDVPIQEDEDKSIYNSVLETFKELGSQGNTEPKFGDKVLVNSVKGTYPCERILVQILPKEVFNRFICVDSNYEEEFINGKDYGVTRWKFMKPIKENSFKEISEDTFEVTF